MAFEEFLDAKRVLDVLGKRFARYGLSLHPDKTRFVDFRNTRPDGTNTKSLRSRLVEDSQRGLSLIQDGERRRFAMSIPIPLRGDFNASQLRGLAKRAKDGRQARRLLALAAIYDGATRSEAAKLGDVGLQIIRDWVLRFNARGPDGLLNGKSPGQPPKLNDTQRRAVARMIESGPIPAVHGVVRWRLIDLAQWIFEEFRVTIAKQTLSRELRAMGYRKLSARPRHHAQAAGAVEDFKKTSQRAWMKSRVKKRSMSRP
jgi:transposase